MKTIPANGRHSGEAVPGQAQRLSASHRQRGVSLVMALIFMSILMVAGAAATHNTNLQERMAGNTRNRDLAFQAAEFALRDAESTLTALRLLAFDGSVAGLSTYSNGSPHANDRTYWGDTGNWSSYRTPAASVSLVAQQPRYLVEKMPPVGTTEYYRVTARGVGGDSNAIVILQALYSYNP